jgi:hypothetical protein
MRGAGDPRIQLKRSISILSLRTGYSVQGDLEIHESRICGCFFSESLVTGEATSWVMGQVSDKNWDLRRSRARMGDVRGHWDLGVETTQE